MSVFRFIPQLCGRIPDKHSNNLFQFSYLWENFKFADCELVGECDLTMEVHNEKYHYENFECGICDSAAKILDDLKMHLFTCEIYHYLKCDEVNKSLSKIRKHALGKHREFIKETKLVNT